MSDSFLSNKGQLTLFMILGVVIVVLIGLFLLFRPGTDKISQISEVPLELQPIQNYVQDCLKDVSAKGIQLLGVQGGHIFDKGNELSTTYGNISYGYYEGRDVLPSIADMQNEISIYVGLALPACTNLSLFKEFNISHENLSVKTTILPNNVVVEVNYPLHAKSSNFEGRIDRFIYDVPIRLGHIDSIAESIINKTVHDPEWVDLTFLSGFDVFVSIVPNDNERFVYSLTDNSSLVNNQPYLFLFANKFVVNRAPLLNVPSILSFRDGVPVNMKLNATDPENGDIIFSDDSPFFDISEDGVILFVPEIPGIFNVTFTVEDDYKNIVSKTTTMIIQ